MDFLPLHDGFAREIRTPTTLWTLAVAAEALHRPHRSESQRKIVFAGQRNGRRLRKAKFTA
jgi:hypothetical protein